MANYYLGTITEVLDPDLYQIKIDIPGLSREVTAYPIRGELDEPRVGDQVLVRDIDPVFHSFYLYSEIKDDEFIGFRSRGKMIHVKNKGDENFIRICVFDDTDKYEQNDPQIPKDDKIRAWLKIDDKGNIEIDANRKETEEGNIKITLKGNMRIEVKGDSGINVESKNNILIKSDEDVKVDAKNIIVEGDKDINLKASNITIQSNSKTKIAGSGSILEVNGNVAPNVLGPFCSIPICPLLGTPHRGTQAKIII